MQPKTQMRLQDMLRIITKIGSEIAKTKSHIGQDTADQKNPGLGEQHGMKYTLKRVPHIITRLPTNKILVQKILMHSY